ncbi:hypothetical protein, partial [Janthinobacterium sp.]|uniref:hypothetical protein n=1 Tax=Janthinobacterium sp. TaxID=1871054 RepID=UPI0025C6195B
MHKRLGLEAVCDANDVLADAGCNRQRGDARRYLGFAFHIPSLHVLDAANSNKDARQGHGGRRKKSTRGC